MSLSNDSMILFMSIMTISLCYHYPFSFYSIHPSSTSIHLSTVITIIISINTFLSILIMIINVIPSILFLTLSLLFLYSFYLFMYIMSLSLLIINPSFPIYSYSLIDSHCSYSYNVLYHSLSLLSSSNILSPTIP